MTACHKLAIDQCRTLTSRGNLAGKRVKLSFIGEEDGGDARLQSGGASNAAGREEGAAGPDSVLQKRQFRGQRIETPTYTGRAIASLRMFRIAACHTSFHPIWGALSELVCKLSRVSDPSSCCALRATVEHSLPSVSG